MPYAKDLRVGDVLPRWTGETQTIIKIEKAPEGIYLTCIGDTTGEDSYPLLSPDEPIEAIGAP